MKNRGENMEQMYMSAKQVGEQLGIAESTAYAQIRRWNTELRRKGYFTKAGWIPKAYFAEKCYGYKDKTETDKRE